MALSKQVARELYRPLGPKVISIASPVNLSTGQSLAFNQQVDLSLPIRGIQLVFKGRDTVVGGVATPTPEGFLNFISDITIQGVNARQQGNLTLWKIPLSTLFNVLHLHQPRAAIYDIANPAATPAVPETLVTQPSTPFPTASFNPTTTAGTFDFRIAINIPFYPISFHGFGKSPFAVPLFAVRNEEWKDSLQLLFTFAGQANGAVDGPLGTGSATTTHTFTAFGSTTGSPSIDLYSLPFLSGLTSKDSYLPGVLSRVNFPITTTIQNAGSNVAIINLQKQPTPRIYVKVGTSTVPEIFDTLTDTNITTLGIQLGGNRNVRNTIDIFAHKEIQVDDYATNNIQGYNLLDFVQNGNYDSNFPGQDIGDGATFTLNANVTGQTNAAADIVQEQMLHAPTGPLAS